MSKKFNRLLQWHIGKGGPKAHPDADGFNSGFMPSKMFQIAKSLFYWRKNVHGQDILELEPSYYEGSGFLNHPSSPTKPTTWISNIDVIPGGDGRKFIQVTDNITGYRWYRTVHTGGATSSGTGGWVRSEGYEILWSGNSALAEAVTLTAPLTDENGVHRYDGVIIDYETETGQHDRCYGSIYWVSINTTNVNDTAVGADILEGKIEFPTSQTAKMSKNKVINLYQHTDADNASYMQAMDGTIKITRISGIR